MPGVLLGVYPRTGEHIIALESGEAIRVRTAHWLPEPDRWSMDAVQAVRALPRVLRQAQRRGLHKHQHFLGRASAWQVYPQPFVDLIVEAMKKELQDPEWREGVGRKFDISAPVKKLMSIMTILEALDRESEPHSRVCQPRRPWDFFGQMERQFEAAEKDARASAAQAFAA